jgi:hypothetical protein
MGTVFDELEDTQASNAFDELDWESPKAGSAFDELGWEAAKPEVIAKPIQFEDLSAGHPLTIRPDVGRVAPPESSMTYGGPPRDYSGAGGGMAQTMSDIGEQIGAVAGYKGIPFSSIVPETNPDDHPAVAVGKEVARMALGLPEFFTSSLGFTRVASSTCGRMKSKFLSVKHHHHKPHET